uniref:Uncharacterized protein n=1 Tax=Anopheles culicifacies TaxID=139723 RepID=A0A182MG30_9DIPT
MIEMAVYQVVILLRSNGSRYLLDHLNRPIRTAEVDTVRGGPVAVIPVTVATRARLRTRPDASRSAQPFGDTAAAGWVVLQPIHRIRWQWVMVLMMLLLLLLVGRIVILMIVMMVWC